MRLREKETELEGRVRERERDLQLLAKFTGGNCANVSLRNLNNSKVLDNKRLIY